MRAGQQPGGRAGSHPAAGRRESGARATRSCYGQTNTFGRRMTAPCRQPPKRIHRDLADENRIRRDRLTRLLGQMLTDASYFVVGQRLEVAADAPQAALSEAIGVPHPEHLQKMAISKHLATSRSRRSKLFYAAMILDNTTSTWTCLRAIHRPLKTSAVTSSFARRPADRLYSLT